MKRIVVLLYILITLCITLMANVKTVNFSQLSLKSVQVFRNNTFYK